MIVKHVFVAGLSQEKGIGRWNRRKPHGLTYFRSVGPFSLFV